MQILFFIFSFYLFCQEERILEIPTVVIEGIDKSYIKEEFEEKSQMIPGIDVDIPPITYRFYKLQPVLIEKKEEIIEKKWYKIEASLGAGNYEHMDSLCKLEIEKEKFNIDFSLNRERTGREFYRKDKDSIFSEFSFAHRPYIYQASLDYKRHQVYLPYEKKLRHPEFLKLNTKVKKILPHLEYTIGGGFKKIENQQILSALFSFRKENKELFFESELLDHTFFKSYYLIQNFYKENLNFKGGLFYLRGIFPYLELDWLGKSKRFEFFIKEENIDIEEFYDFCNYLDGKNYKLLSPKVGCKFIGKFDISKVLDLNITSEARYLKDFPYIKRVDKKLFIDTKEVNYISCLGRLNYKLTDKLNPYLDFNIYQFSKLVEHYYPINITVGLEYKFANFLSNIWFSFKDGLKSMDEKMPPQEVFNFSIQYKRKFLRASLEVENIFSDNYQIFKDYPKEGFKIKAKIGLCLD